MMFLAFIGLLAIIFSILYLIYHVIRKTKDKERILSKKIFYSTLIGGLSLFMVVALTNTDPNIAQELEEVKADNQILVEEKESLHSENVELTSSLEEWETKQQEQENKISELEATVSSVEEERNALTKEIENVTAESSNFEDQIEELESELSTAENEIVALEEKQSSSNTSTATVASNTETKSASVYFENCTAARNAGAAPVYEGDPGYDTHLDRDRDGVGCE